MTSKDEPPVPAPSPAEEASYEIERRYLVRVAPELWARLGQGTKLRQGYLHHGRPSVRIRFGERRGPVLTCKSGSGVRRREVETVVPEAVAEALWEAAGDHTVEKVRHRIGPWELDRFGGALEGLTLLEIELAHERDPVPQPPEGISILAEVTDVKGFTSGHLASLAPADARAFVAEAYRTFES